MDPDGVNSDTPNLGVNVDIINPYNINLGDVNLDDAKSGKINLVKVILVVIHRIKICRCPCYL